MKNFIAPGDTIILTAPDGTDDTAVLSGGGIQNGNLFGIAVNDIAPGATGPCKTTGIYKMPKIGSQAWARGVKVYWDATNLWLTSTASSHLFVGVAVEAVAGGAGDTEGTVRLSAAGV